MADLNTLARPPQEELAALVERGQAFANQVRAVTYKLNGQAYSSTVSALNQFDADLRRTRAALAAESSPPSSHVVGGFEQEFPLLYWHIAKGKVTAGEPLYGAIITDARGTELGHGESDKSADDAFSIAVAAFRSAIATGDQP